MMIVLLPIPWLLIFSHSFMLICGFAMKPGHTPWLHQLRADGDPPCLLQLCAKVELLRPHHFCVSDDLVDPCLLQHAWLESLDFIGLTIYGLKVNLLDFIYYASKLLLVGFIVYASKLILLCIMFLESLFIAVLVVIPELLVSSFKPTRGVVIKSDYFLWLHQPQDLECRFPRLSGLMLLVVVGCSVTYMLLCHSVEGYLRSHPLTTSTSTLCRFSRWFDIPQRTSCCALLLTIRLEPWLYGGLLLEGDPPLKDDHPFWLHHLLLLVHPRFCSNQDLECSFPRSSGPMLLVVVGCSWTYLFLCHTVEGYLRSYPLTMSTSTLCRPSRWCDTLPRTPCCALLLTISIEPRRPENCAPPGALTAKPGVVDCIVLEIMSYTVIQISSFVTRTMDCITMGIMKCSIMGGTMLRHPELPRGNLPGPRHLQALARDDLPWPFQLRASGDLAALFLLRHTWLEPLADTTRRSARTFSPVIYQVASCRVYFVYAKSSRWERRGSWPSNMHLTSLTCFPPGRGMIAAPFQHWSVEQTGPRRSKRTPGITAALRLYSSILSLTISCVQYPYHPYALHVMNLEFFLGFTCDMKAERSTLRPALRRASQTGCSCWLSPWNRSAHSFFVVQVYLTSTWYVQFCPHSTLDFATATTSVALSAGGACSTCSTSSHECLGSEGVLTTSGREGWDGL